MLMKIIEIINLTNKRSTVLSSICLETARPRIPPATPPITIARNIPKWSSGIYPEIKELSRLAICEKKIIYKEFSAASLLVIEKKKNSATRLTGPPPIPRKEDKFPRTTPTDIQHKGEVI